MRLEELYTEYKEVTRQLNVIRNAQSEEKEEVPYLVAWQSTLQKEIWHWKRIRDKIPTYDEFYSMSKEARDPWTCCKCEEPALVEAPHPGVYCSAACAFKAYE